MRTCKVELTYCSLLRTFARFGRRVKVSIIRVQEKMTDDILFIENKFVVA